MYLGIYHVLWPALMIMKGLLYSVCYWLTTCGSNLLKPVLYSGLPCVLWLTSIWYGDYNINGCIYIYLSRMYLSIHSVIYLSIHSVVSLSIHSLNICWSVEHFIHLFINPSVHPFIYLFIYLFTCIYLSIYLANPGFILGRICFSY